MTSTTKASSSGSLTWIAAIWLAVVLARALFFHEINQALWVLTLLIDGAMILYGTGLAIALALRLRSGDRAAGWFALAVVALGIFVWATPGGRNLGMVFRMLRMQAQYQAVVDGIRSGDETAAGKADFSVEVDEGRNEIAFSWGGILDNWHGIIHDPDGSVMAINLRGESGDSPEMQAARMLFGGTMVKARHLWGSWYYCTFT